MPLEQPNDYFIVWNEEPSFGPCPVCGKNVNFPAGPVVGIISFGPGPTGALCKRCARRRAPRLARMLRIYEKNRE